MSSSSTVDEPSGIVFDVNDLQNFMHFGCYFSNVNGGTITIGKGTQIAPNVGIITTNHSSADPAQHDLALNVTIGKDCWIAMNAVILPGVHLGDRTVVGAGAIVTKSFPQGHCVLAGAPARVLRETA
jgi:acetyltransferase-like isoleucine patch superfamily enzyme